MNNNNKYNYNWIQIGEYLKSLNLLNKWENMKSNFDFFNLLNNIHRIHIIIQINILYFPWIFDLNDSLNDTKIIKKF